MTTPRIVRTTQSFFEALDASLPQERTADGVPSTHDFLATEFDTIRQELSDDYEGATQPWTE